MAAAPEAAGLPLVAVDAPPTPAQVCTIDGS